MTMRNVLYFVAGGCVAWLVFGGDRSTPKNQGNVSGATAYKGEQAIAEPKCTHRPIRNGERNQNQRHDTTKPASSRDVGGLIVLTLSFTFLGVITYWLVPHPMTTISIAALYFYALGEQF